MRLPKLEGKTGSTELNRQFLGYRHVDAPDEGAFYEMENVTSERYPLMAPRSPRAKLYTLQNPGGLCAKTALAWTENGKLYYGGEAVADVSEGEKTFVSMGAWLIVFPDGVRYNTADGTVDAIGQKNVTDGTVNFTLCEADGTAYSDYTVSETEPEDTTKYWLCTGSDPHCLKKYSAATKLWNTIPTTYVMISAAGIGRNLAEGDTVTVSGVLDSVGADLNGEMLLQQAADDAVVVVGFLDETASQTDAVTLERKAPKLDYVVECNNRLWGCSSEENEIYACKLGDATNWNCFAGLATDSYTVSVGSDGPFTGAAVQLGYVLFFKENCLHKVYLTNRADSEYQAEYGRYQDKYSNWADYLDYLTDRADTAYSQDYGEYSDNYNRWQDYLDYLTEREDTAYNQDYGEYSDNYTRWQQMLDYYYGDYRDMVSDEQWQQEFAESQRQFNEQLAFDKQQYADSLAASAASAGGSGSSAGRSSSRSSRSSKSSSDDTVQYWISKIDPMAGSGQSYDSSTRAGKVGIANMINNGYKKGNLTKAQAKSIAAHYGISID